MPLPKLEGLIRLDSATLVGTFVGVPVTVPAGEYFLVPFLAALKAALDPATGRTWTCTVDDDTDAATGKVTLAVSGAATTATWSSTAIRDLLGFTISLASATSWTGLQHAKYLWLPSCGRANLSSPASTSTTRYGARRADFSFSQSPSGASKAISFSKLRNENLEWQQLRSFKTWKEHELVVNESLETFWEDVISLGRKVRLHNDRSSDAVCQVFRIANGGSFEPKFADPRWTGAQALCSIRYMAWGA